jgi:hypothetical protein
MRERFAERSCCPARAPFFSGFGCAIALDRGKIYSA